MNVFATSSQDGGLQGVKSHDSPGFDAESDHVEDASVFGKTSCEDVEQGVSDVPSAVDHNTPLNWPQWKVSCYVKHFHCIAQVY